MGRGRIQGLAIFCVPPVISAVGKATNCLYAHSWDQSEQKPIKNFGKSSCGRTQKLWKIFRALIYRANRAVIFAVLSFLFD